VTPFEAYLLWLYSADTVEIRFTSAWEVLVSWGELPRRLPSIPFDGIDDPSLTLEEVAGRHLEAHRQLWLRQVERYQAVPVEDQDHREDLAQDLLDAQERIGIIERFQRGECLS
jgi:hypothetical protein